MQVTYDLIHFALTRFGGISRMWMELFKRLPDPEIDVTFIAGPAENLVQDYLEKNDFFEGTVVREQASGFYQKFRRLGFYRNLHLLKLNFGNSKGRIFHSTDYINPLFARKSLKVVTTIHDMVFWDQKDRFRKNIWYYDKVWCTYHACRFSDQIITVSEAAKQTIVKQFPWAEGKITVIYHGLEASLLDVPLIENKEKRFLFIGSRNGHKNFELLVKAFSEFICDHPDWQIHLTGPNELSLDQEVKLFAGLEISDKIVDHGLVAQEELVSLLQSAGALVITSLNEGFNFPLLEAMAAGCPVLSSDIPVSRELGEGHVEFFSPHSVSELLEKLRQLADNPPPPAQLLKSQNYARSFMWEKSFESLKSVYRDCLQS